MGKNYHKIVNSIKQFQKQTSNKWPEGVPIMKPNNATISQGSSMLTQYWRNFKYGDSFLKDLVKVGSALMPIPIFQGVKALNIAKKIKTVSKPSKTLKAPKYNNLNEVADDMFDNTIKRMEMLRTNEMNIADKGINKIKKLININ